LSGIFGVFNRDGKAVTQGDLDAMHQVFAQWFDDDHGIWCEGNVGLGHTMLWNTPESKLESLPCVDGPIGHRLVITADVRLDNRAELIETLKIQHALETVTDSHLLLLAYRKWGDGSPKYLLGDFAYVIWDECEQKIFCARDQLGIKPLYYHQSNDLLVFSNDIRPLLAHTGVPSGHDSLRALYYLYDESHSRRTFHRAIRKLPCASTVSFTSQSVSEQIFWRAENCAEVKFETEQEYADALLILLKQAVSDRTRSAFPVVSHLSGGLDSSCISVLAARELKGAKWPLTTFNWVPAPEGLDDPEYFEWGLARKVAEQEGITLTNVALSQDFVSNAYRTQALMVNNTQYLWYENVVLGEAGDLGSRTILSGWGGDELISNNGVAFYAHLFWRVNPLKAIRQLYALAGGRIQYSKRFLKLIYRTVVIPVLPQKLYLRAMGMGQFSWDYLRYATPKFNRFAQGNAPEPGHVSRVGVRSRQLALLNQGHIVERIESWAADALPRGVEHRYPLLDRRIVEFALGLPSDMYCNNGRGRHIFRLAISGIVPDAVVKNTNKNENARVTELERLMYSAQNAWAQSPESGASSDYIDREKLLQAIENTRNQWDKMAPQDKLEALLVIYRSIVLWHL